MLRVRSVSDAEEEQEKVEKLHFSKHTKAPWNHIADLNTRFLPLILPQAGWVQPLFM